MQECDLKNRNLFVNGEIDFLVLAALSWKEKTKALIFCLISCGLASLFWALKSPPVSISIPSWSVVVPSDTTIVETFRIDGKALFEEDKKKTSLKIESVDIGFDNIVLRGKLEIDDRPVKSKEVFDLINELVADRKIKAKNLSELNLSRLLLVEQEKQVLRSKILSFPTTATPRGYSIASPYEEYLTMVSRSDLSESEKLNSVDAFLKAVKYQVSAQRNFTANQDRFEIFSLIEKNINVEQVEISKNEVTVAAFSTRLPYFLIIGLSLGISIFVIYLMSTEFLQSYKSSKESSQT